MYLLTVKRCDYDHHTRCCAPSSDHKYFNQPVSSLVVWCCPCIKATTANPTPVMNPIRYRIIKPMSHRHWLISFSWQIWMMAPRYGAWLSIINWNYSFHGPVWWMYRNWKQNNWLKGINTPLLFKKKIKQVR